DGHGWPASGMVRREPTRGRVLTPAARAAPTRLRRRRQRVARSWWRAAVSSYCETRSRAGARSRRQPRLAPAPAPAGRPRATATRPACSPALLLVHPYIVHPHRLREDGRCIRTARPVATHGYVENDEKRVVVHPPPRQVLRGDR